jgi:hypothetical protein
LTSITKVDCAPNVLGSGAVDVLVVEVVVVVALLVLLE